MRLNDKVSILLFSFWGLFGLSVSAQTPAELKVAVDTGNTEAMVKLSEAYLFGMDLKQSDDSASYWLKKAADANNPNALFLLGVQKCGKVFSASTFASGIKYLKKAADLDHAESCAKLSEIYRTGKKETETDKYYSYAKAFAYAKQAADLGNEDGCMYAALAYAKGRGTQRNDSLANFYYSRAASEMENPNAQIVLGERYMKGLIGGKADLWKALEYYQAAYKNPRSNIDVRTDADIHIHEVDQLVKKTHNLMMQSSGLLPFGLFEYRLREM